MIDKTEVTGYSVTGISAILTTIQENPTAQLTLFILNLCLLLLTILYTIIKIVKSVRNAKADGVITEEEKTHIKHTFKEGLLNILDKIKCLFTKGDKTDGTNHKTEKDD